MAARALAIGSPRYAQCEIADHDNGVTRIRDHARVVVHFHAARLDINGRTVAEAFLDDGIEARAPALRNLQMTADTSFSEYFWAKSVERY